MISFDVLALFTSIPVTDAVKAIEEKLEAKTRWKEKAPLGKAKMLELLTFCLDMTYFAYNGNFTNRNMALLWAPQFFR